MRALQNGRVWSSPDEGIICGWSTEHRFAHNKLQNFQTTTNKEQYIMQMQFQAAVHTMATGKYIFNFLYSLHKLYDLVCLKNSIIIIQRFL